MSTETVDKIDEAAKEVEKAEEKLKEAETEAIEETLEQTAECADRAEVTAMNAMIDAATAHERIDETERELEHHEESDQWLRQEMERLKTEVQELRSMISTQNLSMASPSTPPTLSGEPTAEVSAVEVEAEPVAPETMDHDSTETEASLKSAEENPEAKTPKRRHRLV